MATIHLVRHGQSSANAAGILAGRSEHIDLTERGRDEIAALAELLPPRPPDRLLRSPLLRCRTSAEVLVRTGDWSAEIAIEPELVEVDYGAWTALPLAELRERPEWMLLAAAPQDFVFPDGESLAQVADRASRLLDRLGQELAPEETAVLVSHGDVIQLILAAALRLPLADYRRLQVRTGSLSTIVTGPEGPAVTLVGATGRPAEADPPAGLGGA